MHIRDIMHPKLIPLILFLASLTSLFFFRESLTISLFHWALQRQCTTLLGTELHYDSIDLSSYTTCTLSRPLLFDTTDDADGGYKLEAERLTIAAEFDIFTFGWSFSIAIDSPLLSCVKKSDIPPPLHALLSLPSPSHCKIEVMISDGAIAIIPEHRSDRPPLPTPLWSMDNIAASFAHHPNHGITFHAAALFTDWTRSITKPCEIRSIISPQHTISAYLTVSDSTHLSLDVDLSEEIAVHVTDLDESILSCIHNMLLPSFPALRYIKISQGIVNLDIFASLSDAQQITAITIPRCDIENLTIQGTQSATSLTLSRAFGNMTLDMTAAEPLETITAHIALDGGRILIAPSSTYDITRASLSVVNGILEPSQFTGRYNDIVNEITLYQEEERYQLSCTMAGTVAPFLSLFPSQCQHKMVRIFGKDILEVDSTLSYSSSKIGVEGSLTVNHTDTIHYGFSFYDHTIHDGWFSATNLPLEKYLQPILFKDSDISLQGFGDVKGYFHGMEGSVRYSASTVSLENDELLITTDTIEGGEHFFDLRHLTHHGTLPVAKARYQEKNSGLLFDDASGTVVFQNRRISCNDVQTISEELSLSGDIDILLLGKNALSIDIQLANSVGDFSAMQRFCSHFSASPLWEVPISGHVSAVPYTSFLRIYTKNHHAYFDSEIHGTLSEGTVQHNALLIEDFSSSFIYNHAEKSLSLFDSSGAISSPDDSNMQYALHFPSLTVSRFPHFSSTFSAFLLDGEKEIATLIGSATSNNKHSIHWNIDTEHSHIGNILLNITSLTTTQDFSLSSLEASPIASLHSLHDDLSLLSLVTSIPLADNMLPDTLDGTIPGKVLYQNSEDEYSFSLSGYGIRYGNKDINTLSVTGSFTDNELILQDVIVDDFSANARIRASQNSFSIDSLKIFYHSLPLLSLNGEYDNTNDSFKAVIDLLELDLETITDDFNLSALTPWKPKGTINISGPLRIDNIFHGDTYDITTESTLSLANNVLTSPDNAIHIETCDNIQCTINSLRLDKKTAAFYLNTLAFHIPEPCVQTFSHALPFDTTARPLSGEITMLHAPNEFHWQLSLDDGRYSLFGADHDFNDISLEYNAGTITLSSCCIYNHHPFWIVGKTNIHTSDYYELLIGDEHPEQLYTKGLSPLSLLWERDDTGSILFQKAEGSFSGANAYIIPMKIPSSSDLLFLQGKVQFDLNTLRWIFSPDIQSLIERYKLLDGYEIVGRGALSPSTLQLAQFKGVFKGKNCEINGYSLDSMSSQFDYSDNTITLKNFRIKDESGSLTSDDISLEKDDDRRWNLSIPNLTVTNFRPSVLKKEAFQPQKKFTPLLIETMTMTDVTGIIGDDSSFIGAGHILFSNRRYNNTKTLFSIPADLINRLGIDTKMMTPVSGEILFHIDDAKIVFVDFKDIYNDSMVSKFCLSTKRDENSYMDFDGNLHVKVKMKQYNIIFKLAELFTITIGGTLSSPTYTIQKQPVAQDEVIKPSRTS